jgi:hypothetical protein
MPLQATSGAASYDAFGGGAAGPTIIPNYIEDVFSTYLYTGTGASQTITNGIDLSTNGGLVWIKGRSDATSHRLTDTTRGVTKSLASNSTSSQLTESTGLTAFGTTGFTIGADTDYNTNASTYVSWTLRKQTKFFEIVTWSGDDIYPRTITHNLGSAPGCIITKNTTEGSDWFTYHRSLGNFQAIRLQTTGTPFVSSNNLWNATSTSFTLTADLGMNVSGSTYIAYIFAHDAGGFGLTGTDNVISCGSFTTDGSGNATVSLGYEPQWVLIKRTNGADSWYLNDNMRGMAVSGNQPNLSPNSSAAESAGGYNTYPNATGFTASVGIASAAHIYIAIRRGPMRVPSTGTSVFSPNVATSGTVTTNFPVSMQILSDKGFSNATLNQQFVDRLRGASSTTTQQGVYLLSSSTAAESSTYPYSSKQWSNTGFSVPQNYEGNSSLYLSFQRAPSFMDVVCWTGTNADQTLTHNLTVVPELIIYKTRATTSNWYTAYSFTSTTYGYSLLNLTTAPGAQAYSGGGPFSAQPNTTQFSVGQFYNPTSAMVAYLFATCPGVSKVGSYTGTGTTKQIDCGFTAGARFVLIKKTSGTGSWYVWDSARGIVSGNDPYLLLNSTAAEVTNTDYIDTYSAGFEISSTAPSEINENGGSFIFFAVA